MRHGCCAACRAVATLAAAAQLQPEGRPPCAAGRSAKCCGSLPKRKRGGCSGLRRGPVQAAGTVHVEPAQAPGPHQADPHAPDAASKPPPCLACQGSAAAKLTVSSCGMRPCSWRCASSRSASSPPGGQAGGADRGTQHVVAECKADRRASLSCGSSQQQHGQRPPAHPLDRLTQLQQPPVHVLQAAQRVPAPERLAACGRRGQGQGQGQGHASTHPFARTRSLRPPAARPALPRAAVASPLACNQQYSALPSRTVHALGQLALLNGVVWRVAPGGERVQQAASFHQPARRVSSRHRVRFTGHRGSAARRSRPSHPVL